MSKANECCVLACDSGEKMREGREGFERDFLAPLQELVKGVSFPPTTSEVLRLLGRISEFAALLPVAAGYVRDLRKVEDALLPSCDTEDPDDPEDPEDPEDPDDPDDPTFDPDLADAIIASNSAQDVATWAETSKITSVRIEPGSICIDHTKRGKWTVEILEGDEENDEVEGSVWIFGEIDGKFHGGTYESKRPNQDCKALGADPPGTTVADLLGPHIKQGPLRNWKPKAGERVGFMEKTLARNNQRTSTGNERSDLRFVIWPDFGAGPNDLADALSVGVSRNWRPQKFTVVADPIRSIGPFDRDPFVIKWRDPTGLNFPIGGNFGPSDHGRFGRGYIVAMNRRDRMRDFLAPLQELVKGVRFRLRAGP